jgi:acetyltransferase
MTIRNLKYMFQPRSIALFGQGQEDNGPDAVILLNLIKAGFQGPVMPVNPHRRAVSGVLTYKAVADLPETPDLAILTMPFGACPALIDALGARGTRAVALVNDELLKSSRARDAALKQAMLNAARPYVLRILGPDRLGMAVPSHQINATLSQNRLLSGPIGLLTQSSAIMRALLNWAEEHNIGFSHMVPLGARLDVDFSDMLDYLAQDNHTHSILMYLERIRNPRKFMSAARVAARVKPVIVLKPRNYDEGRVEDAIYDAAFRRAGLLRVETIESLFNSVETLASAKPVRQNRLLIIGNSRSASLLASDMLRRQGGVLAPVGAATQAALAGVCPPLSHTENPVDLGDHAGPAEYDKALELLLKEPAMDGLLIVHIPGSPVTDEAVARVILARAAASRRLVMISWVGALSTTPSRQLFREAGIATYNTPDEAARSFVDITEYRRNQELLMETPPSIPAEFTPEVRKARHIIQQALAAGRDRLNVEEASELLAAYEIPMVTTRVARNPREAAEKAQELGGNVALKILSPDIPDRAAVGGIALALDSADEVFAAAAAVLRRVEHWAPQARIEGFAVQPMLSRHGAYEAIIGVRMGRLFGSSPVLLFGHGGMESQVINDIAYALPPLNMHLARELMSRTRLYSVLQTSPGRPADLDDVALTLIKVSQMVVDLGEVQELDINPLWVGPTGVLALNAVIRIGEAKTVATERLAIRPYPKELEQTIDLPDGRTFYLRPILPEDEPALRALVQRMPAEDRRLRFFQPIKELSHDMAARLTQLDYDREMAFVMTGAGLAGKADIWGVVRMNADPDMERAEYAIAVDRAMTGLGLGPMLMRCIIEYARHRGVRELYGEVLRENEPMLKLNRVLGFTVKASPDDPNLVRVSLPLQS